MLVKCDRCNGTKKFYGMGYIEKDCTLCNATGVVTKDDHSHLKIQKEPTKESEEKSFESDDIDEEEIEPKPKKRGRKAKNG